jgi:dipeptidyl aminopeptidase/acylaminoacyl peptidase
MSLRRKTKGFSKDAALVARALDSADAAERALVEAMGNRMSAGLFTVSRTGRLVYKEPDAASRRSTHVYSRTGERLHSVEVLTTGNSLSGTGEVIITIGNDLFSIDVSSGIRRRLTTDLRRETSANWSPDGTRVAFSYNSQRSGLSVLDTATGVLERYQLEREGDSVGFAWSGDGHSIVYSGVTTYFPLNLDIWVLDLAKRESRPLVQSPAREHSGTISSGRPNLFAYVSDETGAEEVYVRRLDEPGVPSRISVSGGDAPRWRSDGRELVFLAPDGTVMGVDVRPDGSFAAPKAMFRVPVSRRFSFPQFDMSPDGQRFVAVVESDEPDPLVLIDNWPALLRR